MKSIKKWTLRDPLHPYLSCAERILRINDVKTILTKLQNIRHVDDVVICANILLSFTKKI
jgi:hypothetical protein